MSGEDIKYTVYWKVYEYLTLDSLLSELSNWNKRADCEVWIVWTANLQNWYKITVHVAQLKSVFLTIWKMYQF